MMESLVLFWAAVGGAVRVRRRGPYGCVLSVSDVFTASVLFCPCWTEGAAAEALCNEYIGIARFRKNGTFKHFFSRHVVISNFFYLAKLPDRDAVTHPTPACRHLLLYSNLSPARV